MQYEYRIEGTFVDYLLPVPTAFYGFVVAGCFMVDGLATSYHLDHFGMMAATFAGHHMSLAVGHFVAGDIFSVVAPCYIFATYPVARPLPTLAILPESRRLFSVRSTVVCEMSGHSA